MIRLRLSNRISPQPGQSLRHLDSLTPALQRDIVTLCEAMGWAHVVTTSLVLPDSRFTVAPRADGGVVLTIPGLIPTGLFTHDVDREAFLAVAPTTADALLSEVWVQIPELVAALGLSIESGAGSTGEAPGENVQQDDNNTKPADVSPIEEVKPSSERGSRGRTKFRKADEPWLKDLLTREPHLDHADIKSHLDAKGYAIGNVAITNLITRLGFVQSSEGWRPKDQPSVQPQLIGAE